MEPATKSFDTVHLTPISLPGVNLRTLLSRILIPRYVERSFPREQCLLGGKYYAVARRTLGRDFCPCACLFFFLLLSFFSPPFRIIIYICAFRTIGGTGFSTTRIYGGKIEIYDSTTWNEYVIRIFVLVRKHRVVFYTLYLLRIVEIEKRDKRSQLVYCAANAPETQLNRTVLHTSRPCCIVAIYQNCTRRYRGKKKKKKEKYRKNCSCSWNSDYKKMFPRIWNVAFG